MSKNMQIPFTVGDIQWSALGAAAVTFQSHRIEYVPILQIANVSLFLK